MPERDLIQQAEKFKAALEVQDLKALGRIVEAYAGVQRRLRGEMDALLLEIEHTDKLTAGQVVKLERYRRLMRETQDELNRFSQYLGVEMDTLGRTMVGRGLAESRVLMELSLGDARLAADLRALAPETVETLLGFLDRNGPLYARLGMLTDYTAEMVSNTIVQSVALGRNPRALARELTRAYGMGLTQSLNMARTVQLWSYREASRANYVANSNVVMGWIWQATLSDRTCMSCIAMHGTRHEVGEVLNDHHRGRCVQLPVTILNPRMELPQTGEQWFNSLTDAEKVKMMGQDRLQAYQDGKFKFNQLTREYDDEVYGKMRGEASLKDLVGGGNGTKSFTQGNILDLSNVKSYSDVGKIFDGLDKNLYSVEAHGFTVEGMQRARYRNVNLYYNDRSRSQAESLAVNLESFRRNNGDAVFDKLFGEVDRIVIAERPHISGSNVLATGGQRRITVYGNQSIGYEELIHEAGHTAGNKENIINALRRFTEAGELSPTGYGRVNIDEDIAETIRTYFMDRQKLQWDYNNRYQLMKDFFNG